MPYRINGQCVQVKRDSGWKDLKCYDNKHDAVAYLRALEANVSDAKEQTKKDSMPSSAEDYAYVPDAKRRSISLVRSPRSRQVLEEIKSKSRRMLKGKSLAEYARQLINWLIKIKKQIF